MIERFLYPLLWRHGVWHISSYSKTTRGESKRPDLQLGLDALFKGACVYSPAESLDRS